MSTDGIQASPRIVMAPTNAPDVSSEDRTALGLRRCSVIHSDGRGRCTESVVIPTDFCANHGGFRARAGAIAKRNYIDVMRGSETLRDAFALYYADEDISDVRAELALQRTLLASYLDAVGRTAGADGTVDPDRINAQVIAGITMLNKAIADLAEQVAKAESRNPTSISVSQLGWVVGQVVDAVAEAVATEITGEVAVSAVAAERDPEGIVDGKRPGDLVRRRILARVADSMEALILPTLSTESARKAQIHRLLPEGT